MVKQSLDSDDSICVVVANVDSTVTPTYDDSASNGTWTFVFSNGDDTNCNDARQFQADFECDPNAGDYQIENAGIWIYWPSS